jgi:hypothetical protein
MASTTRRFGKWINGMKGITDEIPMTKKLKSTNMPWNREKLEIKNVSLKKKN